VFKLIFLELEVRQAGKGCLWQGGDNFQAEGTMFLSIYMEVYVTYSKPQCSMLV
jgi:hypothetical protein